MIGHNVYHVIPNEVPILFVIGLISLRLRDGGWAVIGLRWPAHGGEPSCLRSQRRRQESCSAHFVTDPLTAHFWPAAVAPSGFDEIAGHCDGGAPLAADRLDLCRIRRRDRLPRLSANARGRCRWRDPRSAYWIAVLLVSVLFGYGHYYKGPSGIVDSGMAGLVLGAAYVFSGRNLWVCILAHGFIDTFGVVALFFGWNS